VRLLLIAPEVPGRESIRNYSGMWAYYLVREFEAAGVDLIFDPPQHRGADAVEHYARLQVEADHVLALGTRYFEKVPRECIGVLRRKVAGAVTQLHDGESLAWVDCTFTVKKEGRGRKHCHVGWAADPALFVPRQRSDELGILVDHPDYVPDRGDRTAELLADVKAFLAGGMWRAHFKSICALRIADGGTVGATEPLEPYGRKTMPVERMAAAYGRAHLFLVTHPESVGLAVLEASMAGALPLVPRGFVDGGLLGTVRRLSFDGAVPWREALRMIDPADSREIAEGNTWKGIAEKMIGWFEGFRR
jgi:hypothetical protein